MAKICLSLHRNVTQTTKTAHNDWSQLNNRYISDKYTITLRNEFNALQEISEMLTPNNKYENFVNAHMEAAAKCIPTKLRTKQSSLGDIKRKHDNVKTASLYNKKNPTNANALKLKKT